MNANDAPPDGLGHLCPRCQVLVPPDANQCPACGTYFPNIEQRRGDVLGGLLCGAIRGIALVGLVASGAGGWRLIGGQPGFGAVVAIVIGLIVFFVGLTIAGRLDARVYRLEQEHSEQDL